MENKIKIYRAINNLTQQQLAKESCITKQYIYEIEKNKRNPTVKIALNIAKTLNTTVEELFGDKPFEGGVRHE